MANNTLIVIKNGEIQEIKSDDPSALFVVQDLDLEEIDDTYLVEDQIPHRRSSVLTEEELNYFKNY